MENEAMLKRISISIPAEKEMMLVLRLTTAGVLARSGLTVDALDDIKMAVEEACGCLISQTTQSDRMNIVFEVGNGYAACEISCESGTVKCTLDPSEHAVARCILESLVDKVAINEINGVIDSVRLEKTLPR